MEQTITHSWSRNVLVHQIESGLYQRQGQALTNFERTLPPPQSDLARQTLKDPYIFDFLSLGDEAHERDLEHGLTSHLRDFLLELGVGFAFVGSQYHLEVDDLLRHGDDQPSIGIILCKSRNRLVAEYALRDMHAPVGVATYRLTQALPEALKGSLPRIEELEATLREADAAAQADHES